MFFDSLYFPFERVLLHIKFIQPSGIVKMNIKKPSSVPNLNLKTPTTYPAFKKD